MKYLIILFCSLFLLNGCKQNSNSKKFYNANDKNIAVKNQLHNIKIDSVIISNFGKPYILNQYLIISDYKSPDKLIHILDKNTFNHLTSVGNRGQGPGEIANMGILIPDSKRNTFYVIDHGHQALLSFPMDSIFFNPLYTPSKKTDINPMEFPFQMQYVSDTLSYASFMKVLNPGDYIPAVAKWNMQTGKADFMKYNGHPKIKKKRVSFAASAEHNLYAEVYWYHDLITLCDLDGNLKCCLYGEKWNADKSSKEGYYDDIIFCNNKIVASYWGDIRMYTKNGQQSVHQPDKLIIFDLAGNHLATLNIGLPIVAFCFDKENNRIIFSFDDEFQFAYLDLDGII